MLLYVMKVCGIAYGTLCGIVCNIVYGPVCVMIFGMVCCMVMVWCKICGMVLYVVQHMVWYGMV